MSGKMRVHYYRKRISASAAAVFRKAIERGNYVMVKWMIRRNPLLMHCPIGRTVDHPIHVAVRTGHRRIVRLLHRGADLNTRNARRKTPPSPSIVAEKPVGDHPSAVDGSVNEPLDPASVDGTDNKPLDPASVDDTDNEPSDPATPKNEKRCSDVQCTNTEFPKTDLNIEFFKAATQDNTILMNKLLNRGADIEYEDSSTGFTALLVAMKKNYVRSTQFLLEKGANPAVYDVFRWSCLHLAVYYEYSYQILMTMLEKRSIAERLIDCRTSDQETALHLAAKKGNEMAVYALVWAGAEINALDCKSRTPLLTAMHWRKDAVVRYLVYAGATVNRVTGSNDVPLHMAVARNDLPMTEFMLKHGAVVVDPRADVLADRTVIHLASEAGEADLLECLLAFTDQAALNALHERARGGLKPPLVLAASKGHGAAVDVLLARGIDVNASCGDGETALHAAVRANSASLVDRLLDAGACIDARDAASGRRPLDVSVYAWGHRVSVTAHLVHAHRLAKAVVRHDLDTVAFLLACGVSPNMTTESYGTPLHVAVRYKRYRMMSVILSSHRCRTTVRHAGVTPLDYAVATGDRRAVRMITVRDQLFRGRPPSDERTTSRRDAGRRKSI